MTTPTDQRDERDITGEEFELAPIPAPAALEITARLITRGGVRELSVRFGAEDDMPADDEIVKIADDLAQRVWGAHSGLGRRADAQLDIRDRRAPERGGLRRPDRGDYMSGQDRERGRYRR